MARVMEMTTPLGDGTLLFNSMDAVEALGRPFEYHIKAFALSNSIAPESLLGKNVTVKLELPSGVRYFDGYVTRFGLEGVVGRYYRYSIVARPWLWLLSRTADCRIFQHKKVPDIIKEIFGKYGIAVFEEGLAGAYREWEYCVQYRESDFNFVSRLMECEGIYYYFKHTDGKHTMVLVDGPGAHKPFAGLSEVPYIAHERSARLEQEYLTEWNFSCEIQSGAYALDDFDFKKPSTELAVNRKDPFGHPEAKHEVFDYPGAYTSHGDGDNYVRTRLEEVKVRYRDTTGVGNVRALATGHVFKLTGHPRDDQNAQYLVVGARHYFVYNDYEALEGGGGSSYQCQVTVKPANDQFRTARTTNKPHVQGPQTAIVVGPSGDEIYTDNYGRVKVQFHWDRYGKHDENASCWVRVSHPWAGKNWGMVAIPRIGQEVVVDFLEGDPDQPLITGRVYNAEQMPPYALPGNKTQTGILTRSSKGGSAANANEIRFEDKKGDEHLLIHAEKNQMIEVENDETHWVGHDRTKTIDHDETTHVKHDRTETVDNNEKITIGVNRTEQVGNNETITIGVNRTESVGSNETITIGANRTITVGSSETATVALQRTHTVGVNETITVGAAQEITVGATQVFTVGADQTTTVGANQSNSIGANQTTSVGSDRSVTVGGNATETVGGSKTTKVGKGRAAEVADDDALKVGKTFVIEAGDEVCIKTGSASITMKKDGTITIKGKDITVEGSGKINVKASSDVVMKGSKITQN